MIRARRDPHHGSCVYYLVRNGFALFARLYGGLSLHGREHVPRSGPVVLMANHASVLDPPLIANLCPRPLCFMAKAELHHGSFWGWVFDQLMTIRVRRGAADMSAFRNCAALLEQRALVGLFPEGTRTPDGRLRPAQLGAIAIALRAGAPIVPVAIHGTFQALARGGPLRPVPIRMAAGPALHFSGDASDRATLQRVGSEVMYEIRRLLERLEAEAARS